jgi:hypothetical protein
MRFNVLTLMLVGTLLSSMPRIQAEPATISTPVHTPFGTYTPIPVEVTPSVPPLHLSPDLAELGPMTEYRLSDAERALLAEHNCFLRTGSYTRLYDIYNDATCKTLPYSSPAMPSCISITHSIAIFSSISRKTSSTRPCDPSQMTCSDRRSSHYNRAPMNGPDRQHATIWPFCRWPRSCSPASCPDSRIPSRPGWSRNGITSPPVRGIVTPRWWVKGCLWITRHSGSAVIIPAVANFIATTGQSPGTVTFRLVWSPRSLATSPAVTPCRHS